MHEEYIKNIFNNCNVGRLLGIEIYDVEEGRAKGRLTLKKEHMNVFKGVHGGILFAFADHVGGACGNTMGKKTLLVESTMQFVRSAVEGDTIIAEAEVSHRAKKIGRIDIKVFKENGEVLAFMHMVFFKTDDDHPTETA
jgi:acyl-CoA thioesterase